MERTKKIVKEMKELFKEFMVEIRKEKRAGEIAKKNSEIR